MGIFIIDLLVVFESGRPGRERSCVFRLSAGCSAFELRDVAEGVGNAPTSAMPILFSRQVQPAYICLPSKNGCQSWTRTNTARLNRPSCYFDTIWQLAIYCAWYPQIK